LIRNSEYGPKKQMLVMAKQTGRNKPADHSIKLQLPQLQFLIKIVNQNLLHHPFVLHNKKDQKHTIVYLFCICSSTSI